MNGTFLVIIIVLLIILIVINIITYNKYKKLRSYDEFAELQFIFRDIIDKINKTTSENISKIEKKIDDMKILNQAYNEKISILEEFNEKFPNINKFIMFLRDLEQKIENQNSIISKLKNEIIEYKAEKYGFNGVYENFNENTVFTKNRVLTDVNEQIKKKINKEDIEEEPEIIIKPQKKVKKDKISQEKKKRKKKKKKSKTRDIISEIIQPRSVVSKDKEKIVVEKHESVDFDSIKDEDLDKKIEELTKIAYNNDLPSNLEVIETNEESYNENKNIDIENIDLNKILNSNLSTEEIAKKLNISVNQVTLFRQMLKNN